MGNFGRSVVWRYLAANSRLLASHYDFGNRTGLWPMDALSQGPLRKIVDRRSRRGMYRGMSHAFRP